MNKIQDPDIEVDYKESPMNSLSKMEKYKFYVNANHSVLKKSQKDDEMMMDNKEFNNYDFSSFANMNKDISPEQFI